MVCSKKHNHHFISDEKPHWKPWTLSVEAHYMINYSDEAAVNLVVDSSDNCESHNVPKSYSSAEVSRVRQNFSDMFVIFHMIITAVHTQTCYTPLTFLPLNQSAIHILFCAPHPHPPRRVMPRVVVQHHSTSPPPSLHPAGPLCRAVLTHDWLNQQFEFRGIHLDCSHHCGLLVIDLFTGTSPCSYTQHTMTLGITS